MSAAADLSGYPDASAVSAFAQDAVAWAVDAGLLTGTGAGTLNPQGTATRAELAALLVRAEASSPPNNLTDQPCRDSSAVPARSRFVLCWGQETQRGYLCTTRMRPFST